MKRIWIAALLVMFALSACTSGDEITPAPLVTAAVAATPLPAGTMPSTGGAAIIVQRSGGIAGTSDQWAIFPDGRVVVGRTKEYRVTPAAVTGLMASIERRGFYTLELAAPVPCADCYTYTVTVASGGRVHSVAWVDGQQDVPEVALDVLDDINTFLSAPGSD